jgi:hypothetical protein
MSDNACVPGGKGRRHPARIELSIFVGLIVLAAAPIFAGRYLPFFDYPAHLQVPAALHHWADPATRISELWTLDLRLVPNSLHYALTYLGAFVMPIETASRLFVALFCIAALPPAVAFLLRTFGRDWRLAALAVPLCWSRCLWYGFIGYCAALPLSLVILALLQRDVRQPALRRELLLAALVALLPFVHFFVMVVTLTLAGALVVANAPGMARRTPLWRSVLPLSTGPLAMAPWFLGSLHSGPEPAGGAAAHLFASRPRAADYLGLLHHWFIDGYTGRFDDVLAVVLVLTLAALLVYPGRARVEPTAEAAASLDRSESERFVPLVLCVVLAALYFVLPFEIRAPFNWWGMNVRVLPPLFVWLLVAVPPGRLDGIGRFILIPAAVTTAAFLIYVAIDVRQSFNGPEGMAGVDEVVAQIPPGSSVLGLYTDYRQRPHYAHYPYHYASSYAVVEGGGMAAPFIPIPQSWTNPRVVPDYPVAGDAALFQFERQAPGFSHFLVRTCVGEGCVPDPLEGRAEVRRLAERGRWRLYQCVASPCGDDLQSAGGVQRRR